MAESDHSCNQQEVDSHDDMDPHSHENGQTGDNHPQAPEPLVESAHIFPDHRSNRGEEGFCHDNHRGVDCNVGEVHDDHNHQQGRGDDLEISSGSGHAACQAEPRRLSRC